MDQSNISKILAVEGFVNQTVDYIKDWTQSELTSFVTKNTLSKKKPLIAKIKKDGYLIGNYIVYKKSYQWKAVSLFSEIEYNFLNKLSAILFAIYKQTNKTSLADYILIHDQEVNRLAIKTEQYQLRFKQAIKKKNNHKIDLFSVRYRESLLKLDESKNRLKKILSSAKYIKS